MSDGSLPLHCIIKATKQCIKEHPVLSTVVLQPTTDTPQLASRLGEHGEAASINLERHLCVLDPFLSDEDNVEGIQRLLGRAHNEPLPNRELHPAWRLYIVPISSTGAPTSITGFHAAFSVSHNLADGTSSLLFHQSFLRALQNASALPFNASWNCEDVVITEHIVPPMEKAANLTISWSYLLRPLLNEYLPPFLSRALGVNSDKPRDIWHGTAVRPTLPNSGQLLPTSLRLKSIPAPTTKRLLPICRNHEVRLTGLLTILTARALSQTLHSHNLPFNNFSASTAIDLRRTIPSAKGKMGCFPSVAQNLLAISHDSETLAPEDWAAARKITDHLAQASSTLTDQRVSLLKYLSNYQEWTLKRAGQAAEGSFEVSNLGVFDAAASRGCGWEVGDMVFSQSADGTGEPLSVNVVSVEGGALNVVVSWWRGMLGGEGEEAFVEEMVGGFGRMVEGLSGEGRGCL